VNEDKNAIYNGNGVVDQPTTPSTILLPKDGQLVPSGSFKESWAECLPLCPKCEQPMSRDGKGWKCVTTKAGDKARMACGGTSTNGRWRVEYFPRIPTLNQKQRIRLNQLTLETWPNQKTAELRVNALKTHFNRIKVVPTQHTSLSAEQCRAGEQYFSKYSLKQLEYSERLLNALENSALKSPDDLIEFLTAYNECGIRCSPKGIVKYCKDTKWPGDLVGRPTFVEAVQRVLRHKIGGFGGEQPISDAQIEKSNSQNGYIMAYFQPNYPEPTYPEVMTDEAIIRFVTYSYDTPRKGMPPTEMEKWRDACAKARREGLQLPPQPIEEEVFKLVPDGTDQDGVKKWKKVPGTLEYPRPWPRTVANSFLIACRALKNAMARSTLCHEPAAWVSPPGDDLRQFLGTKEERAAEALIRAKKRRVLTTAEKQRILNASLDVDGGIGAPSVLWQGWGGGRRADVEKYCKDNLHMVDGRIQIDRWQTKNQSCKDVSAMLNFYLCADFLIKIGKWTEENLERGFSAQTRARILARAGFWEESWGDILSVADSRAGEDFGYKPFEDDEILDLTQLVHRLREPSNPACALVWQGFSDLEKQKLLNYRPSDTLHQEIRNLITRRLNEIMYGPCFYDATAFNGLTLRWRTTDLWQRKPTGANGEYLNRLLLEDVFPNELARKQNYPPNALRRSGMSAMYQVYESKEYTIDYFSTGGTSWEDSYKRSYSKQLAREHWQLLYGFMDRLYSEEDRKGLLPVGHKLDDFRTPAVIEAEEKNTILAKEYIETVPPAVPRQPSGNKYKTKYSTAEKARWVADYLASGLTQKDFAEKHDLVFGVFHRWLTEAGHTTKARSEEEIEEIIAKYKASGLGKREFAESIGLPDRTFWTYLEKAGLTEHFAEYTPEEIAQHVERYKSGSISKADFAASIKVDVTRLNKWLADADVDIDRRTRDHSQVIQQFIEEYNSTGISRAAFAEKLGVNYRTFCSWLEEAEALPDEKWTDEEIATHVEQFHISGKTQEEYAESIGCNKRTLYKWLKAAGLTKPRTPKEQIDAYVTEFRTSGMSQLDYAKSKNIDPTTLHLWLKAAGMTKEQHTNEQLADYAKQFAQSGTNQEVFAASKGISKKTLYKALKLVGLTKKQTSKEKIDAYVTEFRASGLSQAAFAKSKGIVPATLGLWLKAADSNKKPGEDVNQL